MTLLKRIAGFFTGMMFITGISIIFTEKDTIPLALFIFLEIIFAILTYVLFKPSEKAKQRKIEKRDKRKARLKTCIMKHVNGLPIAEGINCKITMEADRFIFSSGSMNFELEKLKITDMCIKTDVEIQQQYVSSVGGAVGGAILSGAVGAMIGGRAKKKVVNRKMHHYLIITYQSDEIKYIGFDINYAMRSAKSYIEDFKNNYNNTISTYQL